MIFDLQKALLLAHLNEACYAFCQTGKCDLPEGFSPPVPVKAMAGSDLLLKEDPETAWIMSTRGPDGQQYIVCRGTQDEYERHRFIVEWCLDLIALPTIPLFPGKVHRGFYTAYRALKPGLKAIGIQSVAIITGHSLGAAIATLIAVEAGLASNLMVFACPRVGDAAFAARLTGSIAIVNAPDLVPRVPEGFTFTNGVIQQRVLVEGPGSAFNLHLAHNLDSYIAGLEKFNAPIRN
jgi:hypothetical protein